MTGEPPDADDRRAAEVARRRAIDAVHARLKEVRRRVLGEPVDVRSPLADERSGEIESDPTKP